MKSFITGLGLLIFLSVQSNGQNLISTIAGTGAAATSGDTGLATAAAVNLPISVAVDGAGNVYVCEQNGHRVRRISPAGIITTLAGTGVAGFSGDGGPATSAQLNGPQSIVADAAGNVYIADTQNSRVRKVGTDGRITTVAGNGVAVISGDAGQAVNASVGFPLAVALDPAGNLHIAAASSVRKVSTAGTITTLFTVVSAPFVPAQVTGLAVDAAGAVYGLVPQQRTVVRFASGALSTFAGSSAQGSTGDGGPATAATFTVPTSLTLDTAGNLYISDTGANRVRRVGTDGIINPVAGTGTAGFAGDGGAAVNAQLNAPTGLVIDAAGSLLIADSTNHRVRKVALAPVCPFALSPNVLTFNVASTGGVVSAGTLQTTAGCSWVAASDSTWLTVSPASGTGNAAISFSAAANTSGAARTAIVTIGSLRVTVIQPGAPCTYSVTPTSQTFTTTGGSGTIAVTAAEGCAWTASSNNAFVTVRVASGVGNGSVGFDVAVNSSTLTRQAQLTIAGQTVTITQTGNCTFTLSPTSELRSGSSSRSASFNLVTSTGCTWTASTSESWITVVTRNGTGSGTISFQVTANRTGASRTGTIQAADQIYTVNQVSALLGTTGLIQTLAGNGTPGFAGEGSAASGAQLRQATGIALDKYGNVYFADSDNHRVRKIDPSGVITTIAGTGSPGFSGDAGPAVNTQLNTPYSVAVDGNGLIYIADQKNYRIRRIAIDGTITSVAGTGTSGYSGDSGQATNAAISDVYGITVDSFNQLYLADRNNHRIRRISTSGIITTVAGRGVFGFTGDGGGALNASLAFPEGVAVVGTTFYIADTANNRVRRVSGGIINTFAGNGAGGFAGDGGAAASATLSLPRGVALPAGGPENVYIADGDNNRIRRVSGGIISTVVGNGSAGFSGDGGLATAASIRGQRTLAVDDDENIFFADTDNFRIRAASLVGCTYGLVPANLNFVSSGGTGGFQILTQEACNWTVTSQAPWLVLTSAASGRGNGAVFFSFTNNTGSARTGTITVADQTFTVNQEGPPANLNLTSFEPRLVRTLEPGFYILEASLATGALGGAWGLEVVSSAGQAPGGFNLGGGLAANAATPGFGAFLINATQTVTATLNAQTSTGTVLTLRYLDSNRRQVGTPVTGLSPLRLTQSLTPGFYIVEVYSSGPAPFNFQLGLAADFFVGGVNTGGFLGQGSVGFGAFYISDTQEVTMRLFGRTTYGPNGAGDLILTLRDANRNVITTVTPP